ncbi:MAG TPA: 16S rRNA (guanine(527)-N(7))-methyltransferase RsmG [Phycisphaerales bacterium]|nr:16S rRNA (guanine(527)-N(7))-methyltransferase RsmG [Phycisphaerales bacterium]
MPKPTDRAPIAFNFAATQPLPAPPEFIDAAAQLGIEFDEGDVDRLGRFLAMLLEANASALNLTAITEPAAAWEKHILDSLTLLPLLAELPEGARVLDVGSGGGLPGVPLAIVMPHLRFTLLEATGKKVEYLRAVGSALSLANMDVVQGRAETVAHDRGEKSGTGRTGGFREAFDAVTARAVGRVAVLAELTAPFAKVGGMVFLIKGQKAEEELAEGEGALHELKVVHAATVDTPTGRVVVLEKRSATPKLYPRADGEPARRPLGIKKTRGNAD